MKGSGRFRLALVGLGLAAAGGVVVFTACSGNWNPGQLPTSINAGGGDSGVYGDAGAPCAAPPGYFPNPECDDGTESFCAPSTPACNLSGCQAVSTAAGSCEPLTTNPPDGPWGFRMRRLIIAAPEALASTTVQNSVVTNGVDMNEPQCGEEGTGDFSWLLQLDPTALTFKTGGAPPCDIPNTTSSTSSPFPSCDPFNTGYCFLQQQVGAIAVAPVSGTVQKAADGTYFALAPSLGPQINVPIFYNGSIIVLPISQPGVTGLKVTDNGNCIGSFNPEALTSQCADSYKNCSKWLNAGSLSGYITLEAADQVNVLLLSKTLCVILTQSPGVAAADGGPILQCARNADGSIAFKGDYCSTTQSPGGCADSYWLAAAFAASAVKINGDCSGGSSSSSSSSGGSSSSGSSSGSSTTDGGSDGGDGG
jgi:hypothetical protein